MLKAQAAQKNINEIPSKINYSKIDNTECERQAIKKEIFDNSSSDTMLINVSCTLVVRKKKETI